MSERNRFEVHPFRVFAASSGIALFATSLAWEWVPQNGLGINYYQRSGIIIGVSIFLFCIFIRKMSLLIATSLIWIFLFSPPVIAALMPASELCDPEFCALWHLVPDDRLLMRVSPFAGGHDANGFRNDSVPDIASIVAIGDSQTWGFNVSRYEAWPHVLEKLAGEDVYNMATGGFGTVQYRALVEDALNTLDPDVVLIGFYFGNDLYDAYLAAYEYDSYVDLRQDDLVEVLEKYPLPDMAALREGDYLVKFERESTSTIFTPEYRVLGLDLNHIRVQEGLRITELMFRDMRDMTQAKGVRLVIVLIPTKEFVYRDVVPEGFSVEYEELIAMEQQVRSTIIDILEQEQIEYVDSLPALAQNIEQNVPVYLNSVDGHRNATGQVVQAELIYEYLNDVEHARFAN